MALEERLLNQSAPESERQLQGEPYDDQSSEKPMDCSVCDEEQDDFANNSSGQSDGDGSIKKTEPQISRSRASSRELQIPELMGADLYVFRFFVSYQILKVFINYS